ncbi:MAG: type II secretion system GspH family protein, partial [Muribaculaceae bacterium]|nr:type II secretion system GspH family protein [Muribaculaceae bacterium]
AMTIRPLSEGEGRVRVRHAFTLAEVLITLGIIGVVAAMTIPNLMANHQKTVVENRLKSTYSIISNAVRLYEEENGVGYSPDFEGVGWKKAKSKRIFNQFLRPYLKLNFEYSDKECEELIVAYSSVTGSKAYTDKNNSCYYLLNGAAIGFAAGSNSDGINRMALRVITNPMKKKRIDGRDVFVFYIVNGDNGYYVTTVEYMDKSITDKQLKEYCGSTSARINYAGGNWSRAVFCTALIRRNGWKIPTDYPVKF